MLTLPFVVARKELMDHLRDVRALALTLLYTLMGPAVVLLALLQRGTPAPGAGGPPWHLVAAVFALMAAFTASMAAAMDTIAGERERRSLIPLVVSVDSRRQLLLGKWMALSVLSVAGLVLNVVAFVFVLATMNVDRPMVPLLLAAPALLSLAFLAPACELLISTICRGTKEANTYVSLLVFGLMGLAMWTAFRRGGGDGWRLLPMVGQQRLLEVAFSNESSSIVELGVVGLQSLVLTTLTAVLTVIVLAAASTLFSRDEAVYGG